MKLLGQFGQFELCDFEGLCQRCGKIVPKGELYANDNSYGINDLIWICKKCLGIKNE